MKRNLIIGLLFLTIILVRFSWISDRFIFDIDTQYQALLAKTIIRDFHIIWIGVSASNIGYYLGPGLVYLTAFLLWLSKGDPISLAYFSAFIGVVTTLSIYFITNNVWNKKVAISSSIFYGLSSFVISYDHRYWPIFVPLVAVWIFYSLVKAQKNTRWLILSIILISLSYHIHLSLLILWPFIIWSFIKQFKKIKPLTWVSSIVSYLLITSPMLVFDLVHSFDNLKVPFKFLQSLTKTSSTGLNLHFNLLLSLISKVFIPVISLSSANWRIYIIISILLIVTFYRFRIKIRNDLIKYPNKLLLGIIILFSLLFSFYPGPIQEYYIVFLFPFIAIATSLLLNNLPFKYCVLILSLFIIINIFQTLTMKTNRGLSAKKKLIQEVSQKINKPFYLSFPESIDMEGWRYLFEAYGKKPSQSKADSQFGWLYPDDISKTLPKIKVHVSRNTYTLSSYSKQ